MIAFDITKKNRDRCQRRSGLLMILTIDRLATRLAIHTYSSLATTDG